MIAEADIAVHRQAIERDGFVVLRGAVDPEWIAGHRSALRRHVDAHLTAMDPVGKAVGASAVAPTFSLIDAPPDVAAFVTEARIAAIAAALLGVNALRLLHFCGFFKPPAGLPTPWHRDNDFIPLATDRVITAWMPLVPIDAAMGLLSFACASHHGDPAVPPSDFTHAATGPLTPGDISFHLGGTLHAAGPNRTAQTREAMAVSFYANGARIVADGGAPFRAALRAHYFADLAPGDLARSDANPVVFERKARTMAVTT